MKQKLLDKMKKTEGKAEESKQEEEKAEDLEDFLDDLIWNGNV